MEVKLVIKMQILAMAISSSLLIKAISETKMDMVKPMLQMILLVVRNLWRNYKLNLKMIDDKKIEVQFKSWGFLVMPRRLLKYVKRIIPRGLPKSKPKYIPKNTVGKLVKFKLLLMEIPVLAKAKRGIIIKLLISRKCFWI